LPRRTLAVCALAPWLLAAGIRDSLAACPPCTVVQPLGSGSGIAAAAPDGVGQSFTACADGELTGIVVTGISADPSPVTLGLQAGLGVDAPVYTETVALQTGSQLLALAQPFPVSEGDVYSFALFATQGSLSLDDHADVYPDGTAFLQTPGMPPALSATDLAFQVMIGPSACQIAQLQETGGFGANAPGGVGQSFLACANGSVTSVSVKVTSLNSPPVTLGLQEGLGASAPTYTQAATLGPGVNTITLATPFPVTAGTVYSFALFATSDAFGVRSASGDPYPDGTFFFQEPGAIPTFFSGDPDLRFTLDIASCLAATGAPETVAAVPFPARAFPNPAQGDVTVRFDLAAATRARVQIYAVDGRLVATIADRFWAAGMREIRWNASDVAAGVYFYRVATPERTTGGKIVIRP
jgi:Secretion system C-terminal sorting domain